MNILLLDLTVDFYEGQNQLLHLAVALQETPDCSAFVACVGGSALQKKAQDLGLHVFTVGQPGFFASRFARFKLLWKIRHQPGDWLVHSHDLKGAELGAALQKRRHGIILLHTRNSTQALQNTKQAEKLHRCQAVICTSQEVAFSMAEARVPRQLIYIIPAGIDPSLFPPRKKRDGKRLVLAVAGPLTTDMGYVQLINAMPALAKHRGDAPWEMRIVGSGPLFSELLELARSLAVDNHLAFLGEQNLAKILPDCDLFIAPATAGEGNAMGIKAAWATELPIICSDIPGHMELAVRNETALTFASGLPGDLSEKIITLLQNQPLRQELVKQGKARLQHFTNTRTIHLNLEIYSRMAKIYIAPRPATKNPSVEPAQPGLF